MPSCNADHGELLRQQPRLFQMEQRWQQLLFGQVAGRAKNDDDCSFGNAFCALY
jgi:hypothetical protein